MLKTLPRRFLPYFLAFWMLSVAVGSLMPYSAKSAIGTNRSQWHRVYHIGVFGGTAFVLMLASRQRAWHLAAAVAALGLGFGVEWAQATVYSNEFEWWDVRDDGYGALAALLLRTISVRGRPSALPPAPDQ